MVGGHLTPLYCLLLIAVQCWQGCSNIGNTGHLETTHEEDCQCLRSKELFDIIKDIIKQSGLRKLTVMTDATGLCGDLTHLEGVLLVMACSIYQSSNPLLARPTTLSTIIIDCDQQTSEDIIFHYLSARTSGQMERRLILPVYNFIFTKQVDINTTRSVDLTANHFVTISQSHTKPSVKSYFRNMSCATKSMCKSSVYTIWRAKGDGRPIPMGEYSNGYDGNTARLRNNFHNFEGMRLKVTTVRYTPFTMGKNGNYYGFCMELLETIAKHLNFTYDIIYSVDKQFGIKKNNGKWNGMMGMMERKEVDMIVAGLTITSHREEVVDFTVPFFEETSTVLVRANLTKQDDLWTYLFAPLQLNVWLVIAGSIVMCGFIVKVVEMLGTSVKHFYMSDGKSSQKLSVSESIWLMLASYVKQGAEILPTAGSSQCTIATFWIVTFLVGSLYAANLTASLAIVDQAPPFNTLQELADDQDYKILLNPGSVQRLLLEGSQSGVYAALWRKINRTQNISFQRNTKSAMKLMFKDDRGIRFAVMGDKTSLETKLYKDYASSCDWAFIPETFFTSGLGVALPENSPYKEAFDEAIMKVMENGLPRRWRKEHFLRPTCHFNKMGAQGEAKAINLDQIKILLVVVGGGMVLSAIVFFLEILSAMIVRISSVDQSQTG